MLLSILIKLIKTNDIGIKYLGLRLSNLINLHNVNISFNKILFLYIFNY